MDGLFSLGMEVERPDAAAGHAAESSPGAPALGRLAPLVAWLAGAQGACPPRLPARIRLVHSGDLAAGTEAAADAAGIGRTPFVAATFEAGLAAADAEIDAGADLLLFAANGAEDAGALAVCAISGSEPVALLPRGAAAADSAAWIKRAIYLRDRRPEVLRLRSAPDDLLAAVDDPGLSAACAFLARAAARRTPLLLDGGLALAAAAVVHSAQTQFGSWWRVADAVPDPVQSAVRDLFRAEPVLDLGLAGANGAAAVLAMAVLRVAVALSTEAPT
jgi:nicotinate-nucleotide--dimethylbenzimidazole phosphoribosyltransferase